MGLLETWRNLAYGEGLNDKEREKLWAGYFTIEKGIYEQILAKPEEVIEGTVKELAEKYNQEMTWEEYATCYVDVSYFDGLYTPPQA